MLSGMRMKVDFPEVARLKKEFDRLRPELARKHLGAAIRRSMDPGKSALKSTTPKGPTGNLRRSITTKVIRYRSGNVVGLVGYSVSGKGKQRTNEGGTVRIGSNLGYIGLSIEFGTRDRYTKGSIASSYKRLGPFQLKSNATQARQGRRLTRQSQRLFGQAARSDARDQRRGGFLNPGRGGLLRSRGAAKLSQAAQKFRVAATVRTTPGYPKAFFKRATKGQRVYLSSMPIGGSTGQPPIKTAYKMALPEMRTQLPLEMADSLRAAFRDIADKFPRKYAS